MAGDAPTQAQNASAVKEVVFGSIAGSTAKLFEHPFDLVKVRLQSQPPDRAPTFKGPLDCFRQTWSREGFRGLYRGISAPLVGASAENACLFLVYNQTQELIRYLQNGTTSRHEGAARKEITMPQLALAAGCAGAAASFLLTPIELIKCRMQVQMLAREGAFGSIAANASLPALGSKAGSRSLAPLPGPLSLIASTVRQHGVRGLWHGQLGTLIRETGGSSAWFSAYEILSRAFLSRRQLTNPEATKKDLSTLELMLSGAAAGMSYNVVLFPADSIKSAMQTEEELRGPSKERSSFWKVGKQIYRNRGIAGLYAGCGLTVARAAPSSALIFLIYETLETEIGHLFA